MAWQLPHCAKPELRHCVRVFSVFFLLLAHLVRIDMVPPVGPLVGNLNVKLQGYFMYFFSKNMTHSSIRFLDFQRATVNQYQMTTKLKLITKNT